MIDNNTLNTLKDFMITYTGYIEKILKLMAGTHIEYDLDILQKCIGIQPPRHDVSSLKTSLKSQRIPNGD